ncbi:MAG: hypothetical protein KGO93_04740 [Cyanobacteria bacterium REEB446]|nr:hypothetical protein [Cyanobacteria bacterium REEB446]
MPDYITIEHARAVVSHTSKLTENKYSEIVAAANNTEKENLKKTAIGPRMADLKPDQVILVGADDNQITKQELIDTFNSYLTGNGGAKLTKDQENYLWNTSRGVIKDPGGSATPTNSPATVPSSPTVTNPSGTNKTSKPAEDTEAPTLSSNSFNTEVTKLNLDADPAPSDGEKNLEKYINLRYGLDLLESKGDVHGVLGGSEQSLVDDTIQNLKNNEDTSFISGYQEDPSLYDNFILKQAIDDYQKIKPTVAATAKEAASNLGNVATMNASAKQALIEVFENYQKKFTKLKEGITEDKLKKYLTDNYDTLKELIDGFPADTAAINGKNKEELITLAVAARNKLNEKISEEFEAITISPKDKKAFLKKYTEIDFSDSGKSIELIKSLSDEELLILNRYSTAYSDFISRDFIIRELSQHKLSLKDTLGLDPYRLSKDSDLVSFTDRENLLKKYDPKNTDLRKNKEFIQGLTPAELVLLGSSLGFVSKQSLLRELDKLGNEGKSLGDILNAEVVSSYLDSEQGLNSKSLKEINKIVNNPQIKAALIKSATKIETPANKEYTEGNALGQLYRLDGSYLVDFGEGNAKFYKSQTELLGLPASISDDDNKFNLLANERRNIIGYDLASQSIYPTSLLRLSQNAGRLKTPGVTDGSNQINTLHTILEKIYASEEKSLGTQEETTKWHQEMKRRVAKLLMSSSDDEFVKNRQEFQKYLNDTYSGIDGWNIFHIDGWRKEFNSADAQTETMLREVQKLLAKSDDSKIKPTTP